MPCSRAVATRALTSQVDGADGDGALVDDDGGPARADAGQPQLAGAATSQSAGTSNCNRSSSTAPSGISIRTMRSP